MSSSTRVVPQGSVQHRALERDGWVVVARSWAARLGATDCDRRQLQALAIGAGEHAAPRALDVDDIAVILALDTATIHDYPGGSATAHAALTASTATVGPARRAYGATGGDGTLEAMTFVDLDDSSAEVHFTVVAPHRRGQGLATAVKAASVLDLLDRGVTTFRTGGSAQNAAILAANRALGFAVDEEWVTLAAPGSAPARNS